MEARAEAAARVRSAVSRDIERMTLADGRVERILISSNGSVFSGLYAEAAEPRALVVALHGGGLDSGYFHGTSHPQLSLLTLGRALGYSVLALDRPGYGASAEVPQEQTTLGGQARTIWAILDDGPQSWDGLEVALLGHSFGSMVAATMAADEKNSDRVLGVEISGIGTTYTPAVPRSTDVKPDRTMHWGDESLYPAGTFDPGIRPHAALPPLEGADALQWPDHMRQITHAVTCPVHVTYAEHEMNWSNTVGEFARCFDSSSRVLVDTQDRSGHNISLGWSGNAYHLRAYAFFEDCRNASRAARS